MANVKVTVLPENATNKAFKVTSADAKIATVDDKNKVTAVAPGTVKLTVTTEDGNKTAEITLTVKAATVAVTGVSVDPAAQELTVGDTFTVA